MNGPTLRPIEILLVEDNEADAVLAKETLGETKLVNTIHHVVDGVEAMAFLRREGKYAQAPRPDVVFLDLNLPRKDGRKVLAEMKADESLRRIPVVIMTSSRDEADVLKAYDLHANCYITKPVDLNRFVEVVKATETFWLAVVTLPRK
jgi:two-component system, chemotaxis family, response regulator Rcp1